MNALSGAMTDSMTMVRRSLRHALRNPLTLFNSIVVPVFLMFFMVQVMGGAFDVGTDYITYATPGLLILTIGYGIGPTATAVNSDMTTGFINRLRVMDVSRAAVLNAHVVAIVLRTLVSVAVVLGVSVLLGFRPAAGPMEWLGAIGLVVLAVLAIGWLTVAAGLAARTPEGAALAGVPLMLLPFLSSAFVPAGTMGAGARQFAEYQPFTPIIETMRGLLTGTPAAGTATAAVAWCAALALIGHVWARVMFARRA